jgi:hypothetical protein
MFTIILQFISGVIADSHKSVKLLITGWATGLRFSTEAREFQHSSTQTYHA